MTKNFTTDLPLKGVFRSLQRFFAAQAMASSQGATSEKGDMLLQTAGHMEQMLSQRSLEVLLLLTLISRRH